MLIRVNYAIGDLVWGVRQQYVLSNADEDDPNHTIAEFWVVQDTIKRITIDLKQTVESRFYQYTVYKVDEDNVLLLPCETQLEAFRMLDTLLQATLGSRIRDGYSNKI